MSVSDPITVDAIGVDRASSEAVLTISDHLDWTVPGHLHLLQEKLNAYLAFIESGEIFKSYPDAQGRAIRIDVVCKYEPDKSSHEFLVRAQRVLRDAGFTLSWRVPD